MGRCKVCGYDVGHNAYCEMGELEALRKDFSAVETLRDRFAMAALTGLLAYSGPEGGYEPVPVQDIPLVAVNCYRYADACLEARKRKPKGE